MKKLLILCSAMVLLLVLVYGCTKAVTSTTTRAEDYKRMVHISELNEGLSQYMSILVDAETRIEYLLYENMYGVGITPLLDADGSPMLYEGDLP